MQKTLKILLVEDEAINAMLMKRELSDAGYGEIAHVTNGNDAVQEALAKPFDLVLMDISLIGKMTGIEAADKILAVKRMPIIFVTGYDDSNIRAKAEALAPLGYLIKPVDMQQLKELFGKIA